MSYLLTLLDSETAVAYARLTYPRFQSALSNLDPGSSFIAIGAHQDGEPLGLALAKFASAPTGEILGSLWSLFVIPENRQKGIGTALMQAMETHLAAADCNTLSLEYLDAPTAPALKQILYKQSWSTPETVGFIAHCPDVRQTIPLVKRVLKRPLPANHEVVRWQDLTQNELENLRQSLIDESMDGSIGGFDPFLEESTIEPANSVVLCHKDRIIGWMMTHRLSPDLIRYTTLYVRPEETPLSQGLTLMVQALKYQTEDTTASRVIYNCNPDKTPAMAQWTERRFVNQGWLDPLRYRYTAQKSLS